MTRRPSRDRRAATSVLGPVLVVLACLLGGCGGGTEQPAASPTESASATDDSTASSSPSPSPSPSGSAQADPSLHEDSVRAQADAAEEAAQAQPKRVRHRHPVYGADVSWPQCPKGTGIPERRGQGQPMPLPEAEFVVIGLTNGPGFTKNPCLDDQLDWARKRHLLVAPYSVISWPAADRYGGARHDGPYGNGTRLGALRNAGYAQATYNIDTMQEHDFRSPAVWVDVEPYPTFPWSRDTTANAAVVEGAVQAYRDSGFEVGFYSTQALWREVVGDLAYGYPEWRAAGHTGEQEALRRCAQGNTFQGGRALITQWTDGKRDFNVTCPGRAGLLNDWFHQY
jgi:hypothetical protein